MSCGFRHFLTLTFAAGVAIWLTAPPAMAQQSGEDTPSFEELEEALKPFVMPRSGPFHPDAISISNAAAIAAWSRSGHADAASRSFSNWNEAGQIPPVCSVCHSGAGFRAFHGLDGGAGGTPPSPIPTGGVVDCETCHNPGLPSISEIRLTSGAMHPVTPAEASCMTCHQARSAGITVANAVADRDDDTPDASLGFVSPHYGIAASTWLGRLGGGGFEYPGRSYSGRFFHARPVATCVSCHDPHMLGVAQETCRTCHENGNPPAIRISRQSFDGSGDITKGIAADIAANAARLKAMVDDYADRVAGMPIVFEPRRPYFFADANRDGRADTAEGGAVGFANWTPRLLKAAYNWVFVTADPGIFAHNPHYALELLYDSIEDLSAPLGVDMATLGIRR